MVHKACACLLASLVLALLPVQSSAQDFGTGNPVAEAWSAFVEAQNAEDGPLAVERIDRVIPLVEGRYGRPSAEMALVLGFRANALQRVGRLVDAESAAREALTISQRVSGPTSVKAMDATNTLAVVLLADRGGGADQRRTFANEAVRLIMDAIVQMDRQPQSGAATLEALRNTLIAAHSVLGQQDEAIAVHAQILQARAATGAPDDPMIQTATVNLAQAYTGAGRYEEAEALLEPLVARLRNGDAAGTPALANALSAYARVALFPERRDAARREAVAIYHRLGCRDPETRRAAKISAGGSGYPWSGSDPDCPGDLRLAREIAGFRGLAYIERVSDPARPFGSVRLLAHGSDVIVMNTRLRYARDQDARAAFGRYRYVHREFVTSAWQATTPP
jgi:tetratricopeptide (TPR) repeat protein